MQDTDLFAFMAIFRELLGVFPKRLSENDVEDLSKAYFGTLRRFTIAELQAGADAWMARGKFFPKPSEWRECIPKRAVVSTAAVPPLTPTEAAEYLDAERKHWQDEPCTCRRCAGAAVTHRFLRFVPETNELGLDVRGRVGDRIVTCGRWLHGDELRRWYEARDRFTSLFAAVLDAHQMKPARMDDETRERLAALKAQKRSILEPESAA